MNDSIKLVLYGFFAIAAPIWLLLSKTDKKPETTTIALDSTTTKAILSFKSTPDQTNAGVTVEFKELDKILKSNADSLNRTLTKNITGLANKIYGNNNPNILVIKTGLDSVKNSLNNINSSLSKLHVQPESPVNSSLPDYLMAIEINEDKLCSLIQQYNELEKEIAGIDSVKKRSDALLANYRLTRKKISNLPYVQELNDIRDSHNNNLNNSILPEIRTTIADLNQQIQNATNAFTIPTNNTAIKSPMSGGVTLSDDQKKNSLLLLNKLSVKLDTLSKNLKFNESLNANKNNNLKLITLKCVFAD